MLRETRIHPEDISVVIQGPLHRQHADGDLAARALQSIRKTLPGAEVVLSTWHHQSTDGLLVEKTISVDEPPSFKDINGNVNNVLRQLVSTQNGIEAASRPYVLKFRADHALLNANLTVIREYDEDVQAKDRFFSSPITVTNFFIRNPVKIPMLFHLSDLVQFGKREDMLNLWSVKSPVAADIFFESSPVFHLLGEFSGYTNLKIVPEQYLLIRFLEKKGLPIQLNRICHTSYSLLKQWEQLLLRHFLIMDWQRSGILFPSRFHHSFYGEKSVYTEKQLQCIAKQLQSRWYFMRYLNVMMNQYVTCWFSRRYLYSIASRLLFALSPTLAKRVKMLIKRSVTN